MVGHNTGVFPKRGLILYVSSRSEWVLPVWVDFNEPGMTEFIEQVEGYLAYLRSANLYKFAVPRIGDHCSDEWCPYKAICKNRIIPPAGSMVSPGTSAPAMNFTGVIP
jgi:hypothetical protein